MKYPVAACCIVTGYERETVSVIEPLCTPLDVPSEQIELAKADDVDVMFHADAYGLTKSTTAHLSYMPLLEALVDPRQK